MRDAVIVQAVRTPVGKGKPGGALHPVHPVDLLAHSLREVVARSGIDPSLIDDGALNVVVVCGGPTGIESVGALAELYRSNFAADYPTLPQERARLILVEAGPDLFPMFKQDIRDYTRRELEKRGVAVSPYSVALAWNGGIKAVTAARPPASAVDYATRAANLAADIGRGRLADAR